MKSISIRSFLGAKDFKESRKFYTELGFKEFVIDKKMSWYQVNDQLSFYLQDYYVKDWVDNSMIFLEVEDVDLWEKELKAKGLEQAYKHVRFTEMKHFDWGKEFFMHDPSGILWHFGEFTK